MGGQGERSKRERERERQRRRRRWKWRRGRTGSMKPLFPPSMLWNMFCKTTATRGWRVFDKCLPRQYCLAPVRRAAMCLSHHITNMRLLCTCYSSEHLPAPASRLTQLSAEGCYAHSRATASCALRLSVPRRSSRCLADSSSSSRWCSVSSISQATNGGSERRRTHPSSVKLVMYRRTLIDMSEICSISSIRRMCNRT